MRSVAVLILLALALRPTQCVYDAIVIGSGMAGIAAARQILSTAGRSVLVLEVRDRIGGRIHTVPLNIRDPNNATAPATIDLGASWVHGIGTASNPNPMVVVSNAAQLPVLQVRAVEKFFDNQGRPDNKTWVNAYKTAEQRFKRYYWNNYIPGRLPGFPPSDSDSLQMVLDRLIADNNLNRLQVETTKQYLQTEIVLDYAEDLSLMSARYSMLDRVWGGPDALPPRGYGALVSYLAAGVPVQLGARVDCIDYSNASLVVVNGTFLGNGTGFSLRAKYVVNTMPLGYLKYQLNRTAPTLFKPPLERNQTDAVLSFGMGLLQKIILVWNNSSWWDNLLTSPWVSVRDPINPGQFSEYYNYAATPARLPVLICWNGGSFARSVEALDDATIVARALAPLQRLLPAGRALPPPAQTIVTRWQADPWTRGSYSYIAAGAAAGARRAAFRSLGGGRVLFAGEHTHEVYPATVHGAYLSGDAAGGEVAARLAAARA